MSLNLRYVVSDTTDAYENLATEEYLTFNVREDECVLFLWQNANTVVIGKNQNAWKECNVSLLEEASGKVARRMSGGGAVYHDLGNLNFTFCAKKKNFDKERQTKVILKAMKLLGVEALRSGRNDLLIEGKKFSGHAYFRHKDFCYHHGTIMFDVNKEDIAKYLNVSKEKLDSKGVNSVKSRVINIKEINDKITLRSLKVALLEAFEKEYKGVATRCKTNETSKELVDKYKSYEWIYGKDLPFTHEISNRFNWGEITVRVNVNEGFIKGCKCYTDALDVELAHLVSESLIGERYKIKDIYNCQKDEYEPMVNEVIRLVSEKI
ncbi:MAG: lipoate--protein ligase [Peptostreptococcaceae bacterium]|nr:lipoate--protein ligase [Peptostreptococcaceae bacterium]